MTCQQGMIDDGVCWHEPIEESHPVTVAACPHLRQVTPEPWYGLFKCLDCGAVGDVPLPQDPERCPSCGKPHEWHGRDEAQRVCGECRWSD